MAQAINRTNFKLKDSVHTPDYDPADWLINPDLSGVAGVLQKYWKVVGNSVVEMDQAEKNAVDAASQLPPQLLDAYSEAETQNGSATYVAKATVVPSNINSNARHRIGWYCEVNNTSTSGRTQVKVDYDGTVIAEPSIESEDKEDWVPFSGFIHINAGVVPSLITLSFRRQSAGTSKVRRARLEIVRV